MSTQKKSNGPSTSPGIARQRVDWRDFRVLFLCVGLWVIVHAINALAPDWNTGDSLTIAPAVALIGYIFLRARRSPEKLESWGITTPLTFASISVFVAFLVSGILLSGLIARQMGNELRFQPDYLFRMLEYFPSGFTQQFFLCSVLLVSLETVPALKGTWRLPLLMGILFGAVHLHSPFYITGFPIPPVAVGTFFLGFIATWYFLRFRNMIPLACLHAIGFVLFVNWIETPQNLQTPISTVEKNMDSDRRMTWWQKPGLGVCYSVEHQPGWNWDRNFVKYNKEFSDEHGKIKFRGPHWKVEEWIAFSKELGVDFHMAQTKWCDGICFFETELTDWKSPDDYVEKFARMSREARIPFSLYYSTIFDHNPQFDHIQPRKNFLISGIGNEPEYVEYVLGQYRELAEQYRPDSIWLDWYDDSTEATRSSIAFIRKNYPDIALGYNQSHNSKKAREVLDYTSWEGHFLYKLPELNVLQNNLRKEWRTVARILDVGSSTIPGT